MDLLEETLLRIGQLETPEQKWAELERLAENPASQGMSVGVGNFGADLRTILKAHRDGQAATGDPVIDAHLNRIVEQLFK